MRKSREIFEMCGHQFMSVLSAQNHLKANLALLMLREENNMTLPLSQAEVRRESIQAVVRIFYDGIIVLLDGMSPISAASVGMGLKMDHPSDLPIATTGHSAAESTT